MAHRTELNIRIAALTGIGRHTIDRLGVNLNKAGLILSGGRGRHALAMDPEDLKNIVLALLGAESTGRVFETVVMLQALASGDGKKFGDVLLGICRDQGEAEKVMQISVVRNYPQATIYWKDESGTRIGRIQDFRSIPGPSIQPGIKLIASLNGSVLSELVRFVSGVDQGEVLPRK